jgi:filamentous hemagglutinin family protein
MVRFRKTLLTTSALMPLGIIAATANPLGSQVVGGNANVQGQGTSTVTVTQSSDKAIINWQSFNIKSGETTQFAQPNASSVTLNRVTGNMGASAIDGTLTANGRVFLVNPDGILFGAGSKINTGSFLATTNDIHNADFMAGRYQFNISGRPDASIVNLGMITAQNGGFAALVAPGVRNTGTITANFGTVGLVAGNNFSLDFYGDRLVTLDVNDSIAAKVIDVATGQPLRSLVQNDGKLKANGGRVELTAAAARQVVDSVINNTGVIEANSIGSKNGMIVLGAATAAAKPAGAPPQTVKLSGTISAAGRRKNTKGGTIVVTGENIQVTSAVIDASGQAGGGNILIGGDVGGGAGNGAVATNPKAALESFAIGTASTVSVDAATIIKASAKTNGNGGKVVVWSDQATTFYGTINALGGTQGGNGGFVETSGHQSLTFNGVVNTRAPQGKNGLLLLDPLDAIIDTNGGSGIITVSSIQNALLSSNVVVTTVGTIGSQPGDITVAAPVSWSTNTTLTLSAANNIAINAALSGPNGGLAISAGGFGLTGSITATAPINVGIFTLQNGSWIQVSANLPSFFANDFRIGNSTGPPGFSTVSFLRALGGNGASTSPYQIADVYGLQGIGSSPALLSSSFSLATSIDATGSANWNGGAGFVPIGTSLSPFTGMFDGGTRLISGLTIASSAFDVGLFGMLGSGGVVRNLTLSNADIFGTGANNASRDVGVLAGENDGTISNAFVSNSNVSIPSGTAGGLVGSNLGTIGQSSASVTVVGTDPAAVGGVTLGGLAGSNSTVGAFGVITAGTITESSASGEVSSIGAALVGGLVGFNRGAISQSFATVSVQGGTSINFGFTSGSSAGGLVGQNAGAISDSHATGSATGDLSSNAGGLVGSNSGVFGASAPSILRSYATGAVSVGDGGTAGGLAAINAGSITQTFATGPVSGGSDSFVGGLVGSNSLSFSTSNSPVTISQSYAIGSVTGGANSHVGGLVADNIGGSISETYAVGLVTGGGNSIVGGLVAVNSAGTNLVTGVTSPGVISNSYWDMQSSGQSVSAGGNGQTTPQLTGGLPSGFDGTVWTIKPGISYPYFPWQLASTIPIPGVIPPSTPLAPPISIPTPPTLPAGTPAFPTGQTVFFTPFVSEPVMPPPIIATSNVPLNYATSSSSQPPASSPYTFQVDSNGNVVTFENGVRISTGTAQNAEQQYGYNPSSSTASATSTTSVATPVTATNTSNSTATSPSSTSINAVPSAQPTMPLTTTVPPVAGPTQFLPSTTVVALQAAFNNLANSPSEWASASTTLSLINDIIDVLKSGQSLDAVTAIYSSLGLKVPDSVTNYLAVNPSAVLGIDALKVVLMPIVDQAASNLRKHGIPIADDVAESAADTVLNTAMLPVDPQAAVNGQIQDQFLLIASQMQKLSADSSHLLIQAKQYGADDLTQLASIVWTSQQDAQAKLVLTSLATQDAIANSFITGIWPAQITLGKELLILDAVVRAKVLQIEGNEGSIAAIAAAKNQAANADAGSNSAAGLAAGPSFAGSASTSFQNFADGLAAQYGLSGW